MAGRKPLPSYLKVLKGTDQPCRMNKAEPKPKSDKIKMPSSLSDNAKKHWRIVCKQLTDAGIMTNLDVYALAMYCEAFARWKDANDSIIRFGIVVKTPNGFPVQSPFLQIANKAFEQMRTMLVEFGMTPSSRTRVSVKNADSNNDFDDI